MKFEEFNLNENILRGINDAGFVECMPAQERTFKAVFNGKDVTVQSQTGTGKTAAFLISIYQLFEEGKIDKKKALVVVPTRELAVQIEEEAVVLGKFLSYKIVSIYGGVGYKKQQDSIKEGAQIVVGTPGRLLDLAKSGSLDFSEFGVLVIDEADRLFDMGFLPDLKRILRNMPPREQRRTMLFSATLNTRVLNLAWDQMNDYEEIKIESDRVTVDEITQELYHVAGYEKINLLLGVLKKETFENAIIFCNTKHRAVEVAKRLEINGYKTKFLMGDLPQNKRLDVINRMKAGEIQVLVATDVAARGLHVDDLSLVVNYDLPEDYENYVHRIGRTARAGKSGKAVSLACDQYVYHLPAIESYIGDKITVTIADEELFLEDASAGMRIKGLYENERQARAGQGRDGRGGNRGGSRSGSPQGRGRSGGRGPARSEQFKPSESVREGQKKRPPRKQGERPAGKPQEFRARPAGVPEPSAAGRPQSYGGRPAKQGPRKQGPVNQEQRKYESRKPTQKDGVEARLEYYKAKYGEDFKPSPEMLAGTGSGKKNYSRKPSGSGKQAPKTGQQKFQPSRPDVKPAQETAPAKKAGFFKRLFGLGK